MKVTEIILWASSHLGAWGLMLLASWGFGDLFLRKLKFHSFTERLVFTVGLGLGLCSLALFVMGLIGILYPTLILVLTVLGALATALHFLLHKRHLARASFPWKEYWSIEHGKKLYGPRNAGVLFLMIVALSYWGLLLITTQYPPVHWDAISNHLVLARAYLTEHHIAVVEGTISPVVPASNHMLFTWGMALKDDILAQMTQHTFLMLTALGIYAWGKRQNNPALGFGAAAFWLAHPLVLWLASSAYIDIGLTCFVFLGVYALRLFRDEGDSSWWYLSLALLSFAAATKLSGLFFLGVASMFGVWVLARSFIGSWRFVHGAKKGSEVKAPVQASFRFKSLIWGGLVSLAIITPWYAFIAYQTGNPLWPTFPQYSRGIWASPAFIETMNNWMANAGQTRTIRNFLMLSVDWIFHPEHYFAELHLSLFPLIVLWPLAWIIALFNRSVRWWTLWALSFTVFWYFQPQQLRYWLPALPIATLALCESIQWILQKTWKSPSFHNAVWILFVLLVLPWSGWMVLGGIKARGLPPVTPEAREGFLSVLGGHNAVNYVNKRAKNDETVCVLGATWLNYYFKPRFIDLRGALHVNRQPSFRWPDDELWVKWLEYKNVSWIFIGHQDAALNIANQNPVLNPFWPDYQLVYADSQAWVFRHKPVPLDVNAKSDHLFPKRFDKAMVSRVELFKTPARYVDSVQLPSHRP